MTKDAAAVDYMQTIAPSRVAYADELSAGGESLLTRLTRVTRHALAIPLGRQSIQVARPAFEEPTMGSFEPNKNRADRLVRPDQR